jgi:hypothetical protein
MHRALRMALYSSNPSLPGAHKVAVSARLPENNSTPGAGDLIGLPVELRLPFYWFTSVSMGKVRGKLGGLSGDFHKESEEKSGELVPSHFSTVSDFTQQI